MHIVTGKADGDGHVPHGAFLVALAEAVARWRWHDVAALRDRGLELMSGQELSDAILVAAGFNGITRVADAIGIRLDQRMADASDDWRAEIGIDAFAPPEKWGRVGRASKPTLAAPSRNPGIPANVPDRSDA